MEPTPHDTADDLQVLVLTGRDCSILAAAADCLADLIDRAVQDRIRAGWKIADISELAAKGEHIKVLSARLRENEV